MVYSIQIILPRYVTIQKYSTIDLIDRRLKLYEVDIILLCDQESVDEDVCPEPVDQDDMDDCLLEKARAGKHINY